MNEPKFSFGDYVYCWWNYNGCKSSKEKTDECDRKISGVIVKISFDPTGEIYYNVVHSTGYFLINESSLNPLTLAETN